MLMVGVYAVLGRQGMFVVPSRCRSILVFIIIVVLDVVLVNVKEVQRKVGVALWGV